jgi:hypothetical protein
MKKFLFSLLSITVLSIAAYADQPVNYGNNVYSIYSENFNGVKTSLEKWTGQTNNGVKTQNPELSDRDRTYWSEWNGGGDGLGIIDIRGDMSYTGTEERIDGAQYYRYISKQGNGWSGFSIVFKDSAGGDGGNILRDMSLYAGGTIEFWARSNDTASQGYKAGLKNTLVDGQGDKVVVISNYGFAADNSWHKVVIPISALGADLTIVSNPFHFITSNITSMIDIDQIVWKKAGNAVSWSVKLKNVSNSQDAGSGPITWTPSLPGSWKTANQYFELKLDCIPSKHWGIQIFSDAKSSSASPKYTGASTDTAFGLVNVEDPARMLPMAWRVTDKALPFVGTGSNGSYNQTLELALTPEGVTPVGLYDSGSLANGINIPLGDRYGWQPWFFLKDRAQYSSDAALEADDYTKVWTYKGFHGSPDNYWGMSAGSMTNMQIAPKLYLAADFSRAFANRTYTNNSIVLRLFYE